MENDFILVFDNRCGLCVRLSRLIHSLDKEKRVTLLSLDTLDAMAYAPVPPERAHDRLTLRTPDGTLHQGVNAVAVLTRTLPALSAFRWIFKIGAGRKAAATAYGTAALIRRTLCRDCKNTRRSERRKS